MSRPDVLTMTLWQSRRSLAGWTVGMAAVTLVYSASYPSLAKTKAAALEGYPANLRKALNLNDFASPAGYLSSTVFGILLLILGTVFAIVTATRAIAGEEETGVLDLLLAHPVTRRQVLLERMGALAICFLAMGAVVVLVLLAVRGPAGLTVGAADLAAISVQWVLLGSCLGSVVLMISAATGRRSTTIGASSALAGVAYLADTFLPLLPGLGWVKQLSPYHWFVAGDPLRNGLQPGGCLLLLGLTAAALLAAVAAFDRRDLNV